MRVQNAVVKPFDVSRLEEEVREAAQQHPPHIQALERAPRIAPPVPDYVSHRDDTTEIGKLSAEAIVKEYEETAKEIEAMGDVVREMVQRCEQLTSSASTMLKDIKTTAARYRKEGKRMFTEIESCSSATDEVRRLCEAFRDKIAAKEAGASK
jgi:signal transduction protein with GAF and PtsI domain